MKKTVFSILTLVFCAGTIVTGTLGALQETVKLTGTTFNVSAGAGQGGSGGGGGTSSNQFLKMLQSLSGSSADSNLGDIKVGPVFNNVDVMWTDQAVVKIHNKGGVDVDVIAKADYISDPDTLRDDIYVEILEWNDSNSNGTYEVGEEGQSYKRDTILRLRNDTFLLGKITPSQTKGYVLKFDGSGISSVNAGKSAVYDFTFTGVQSTL